MTISAVTVVRINNKFLFKILSDFININPLITEWIIIKLPICILPDDLKCDNATIKVIDKPEPTINADDIINDYCVILDEDNYYFKDSIINGYNLLSMQDTGMLSYDTVYTYDLMLNGLFKMNYENIFMFKKYNDKKQLLSCENLFIKLLHNNNLMYNRSNYLTDILTKPMEVSIESLNNLVTIEILSTYVSILRNHKEYDIAYLAGGFYRSVPWDPTDENLGGSEQALYNITKEWASIGKRVVVYAHVNRFVTIDNVDYVPWQFFDRTIEYPVLVLWRHYGLQTFSYIEFKYKKLLIDLHDSYKTLEHIKNLQDIFDKGTPMFKSNYHKESVETNLNIKVNNYAIIENGTRKDIFKNLNLKRNPYRFCYTSSGDRGLLEILLYIWPIIIEEIPQAEFHIYYGLSYLDSKYADLIRTTLGNSKGVMYHGRRPVQEIGYERNISTFNLYLNESEAEIDCISIKESVVAGCIPIISNFGVYAERQGVHYDFKQDKEHLKSVAKEIVKLAQDDEKVKMIRESFDTSSIPDWSTISKQWIEIV